MSDEPDYTIVLEFEWGGVPAEVTRDDDMLEVVITEDPTFELVAKVAEVFGTRDININRETRDSGGCDTCNFEFGVTVLHVRNATRDPSVQR